MTLPSACSASEQTHEPAQPLPENTQNPTLIVPSTPTHNISITSTQTPTLGPSPTSTPLPTLSSFTWEASPIIIEAAHINTEPLDPLGFAPFFVLYGNGLLLKRSCNQEGCRYLQTMLNQEKLCQLINTVLLTGFLSADPNSFSLPGSNGAEIRLMVAIDQERSVQIPDLDRWAADPAWYQDEAGCVNCFAQAVIDPAFITLYQLLTTYPETEFSGLSTDRLALKISTPIIIGDPIPWPDDLPSLADLASETRCPNEAQKIQAVILKGQNAHSVAEFISTNTKDVPIFTEGDQNYQVETRWLLPYEMPETCQNNPGLYPPVDFPVITWNCEPQMGVISSPTSTITPTPSITPTPLR